MSGQSEQIAELIRLRDSVKTAKSECCVCSGFVIQYEGGCCCQRGRNIRAAESALGLAIQALVETDGPFERTAILADPNTMRITIAFQERKDYETALVFFDMGVSLDEPK